MEEVSEFSPFDHELTIGELFDWTWKIVAQNYVKVLPIFVIVGVIDGLISVAFAPVTIIPNLNLTSTNSTSVNNLASIAGPAIKWASYTFLEYFLILLALYYATGIAISIIDRNFRRVSGSQHQSSIGQPRLNYLNLLITTFLASAIIFLGVFFLFIGALIFGILLYFSLVASSVERKGPFQSLGRSTRIVSARWRRTFVTLMGSFLFVYFLGSFIGTLVSIFLPNNEVDSFITFFAMALLFPVIASSMLVLYYSNKRRQTHKALPFAPTSRSPYDSMRPAPVGIFGSAGTRYCPQCGTQVTPEERFCHSCGHPQGQLQ